MTHNPRLLHHSISIVFVFCFLCGCGCPGSANQNNAETDTNDPVSIQYEEWLTMGKDAIPDLKKALSNNDWRIRTHALLAMGKTGDKSLAPLIAECLRHDNQIAVKNCAISALGELKSNEALADMISYLDKPSAEGPSAEVIVEALGSIADPRAIPALINVVMNRDLSLASKATEALIATGDLSASRQLFARKDELLSKGRARFAARIFGHLPLAGTEPFLLTAAQGNDPAARAAAIESLGLIRYQAAVPILITAMNDRAEIIRKKTADALININSPTSIQPLIELLKAKDYELSMSAAYVLGNMTCQATGNQVFVLFNASTAYNEPCAYVLGRTRYLAAIPLLRIRLSDEKNSGQDEMARALGWMNDTASTPLLLAILDRTSKNGAAGSIWSLGQMKAVSAVPRLIKIIDDDSRPDLTQAAVAALGSIGDRRAVMPIIELYYETGPQYGPVVSTALARLGGSEVLEFIKDNIDCGDEAREQTAGLVLSKSRDMNLVPYAIELLDNNRPRARKFAISALQNLTGQALQTEAEWKKWAENRQ